MERSSYLFWCLSVFRLSHYKIIERTLKYIQQIRTRFRNLLESGGMFLFRYHDASAMKRAAAAKKQKPAKGKALQKNLIQWIERTLDSPLENGFVEGLKSGVVRGGVALP